MFYHIQESFSDSLLSIVHLSVSYFSDFNLQKKNNTRTISTELGTKHSCVKGVQLCSKDFPSRDNNKSTLTTFKSLLLQNHCANLAEHITWMKEINFFPNELGPHPFPRGESIENILTTF